jgi:hypothetical protein
VVQIIIQCEHEAFFTLIDSDRIYPFGHAQNRSKIQSDLEILRRTRSLQIILLYHMTAAQTEVINKVRFVPRIDCSFEIADRRRSIYTTPRAMMEAATTRTASILSQEDKLGRTNSNSSSPASDTASAWVRFGGFRICVTRVEEVNIKNKV